MPIFTVHPSFQQVFIRPFNVQLQSFYQSALVGCLLLILSLSNSVIAQPPTVSWQKALGGTNDEYAQKIVATPDGGYVVAGYTTSNNGDVTGNHGGNDFWVVKLDGNGNKLWQKALGGSGDDYAYGVTVSSDGGYVVVGQTASNDGDVTGNHGGTDFWVVKLGVAGNMLWQKTLGGTGDDNAKSIITNPDGSYIVAGSAASTNGDVTGNHGGADFWVVKLDVEGGIVWQKALGGSSRDEANSVIPTADGGYMVVGGSQSTNGDVTVGRGDLDFWVVKLDSLGGKLWQKTFGGSNYDAANDVATTLDGGYLVVGSTLSGNGDVIGYHRDASSAWYYPDGWVLKLDGSGNLLWQKTVGGNWADGAHAVATTTDGGCVVAGYAGSIDGDLIDHPASSGDYWLVKLNSAGNIAWQKTSGGTNFDQAHSMVSNADNSYVLAGRSRSNNGDVTGNHGFPGTDDFWVVKLQTPLPAITNLSVSSETVCAGQPVLLTATIADSSPGYSFTLTDGTGTNVQGNQLSKAFSQTFTASGSGVQSLTLIVANEAGSSTVSLPITINNDPNCNLTIPCASVKSGSWSDGSTWLCGHEPTVSDLVTVNAGHTVTISINSAQARRLRNKGGTVRYASAGTKLLLQGED